MGEINSILDSVKKKLGLDPETTTEFDGDLIDAINNALSALTQLGVGPSTGYSIHGNSETWDDFLHGDPRLNMARSYVYVRVKLLFDTSSLSSYVLNSLQEQIREYEWRLNVFVESTDSFPPV